MRLLGWSIAPNLVDMASSSATHAAKKTSGDHWYAPDPVSAPFTSVSIAAQPADSLHKMQRAEGARQHTIDDLAVADLILRSSRSSSSCTEAVALSTFYQIEQVEHLMASSRERSRENA